MMQPPACGLQSEFTKINNGQCNKKNHSFQEKNGFLTWHLNQNNICISSHIVQLSSLGPACDNFKYEQNKKQIDTYKEYDDVVTILDEIDKN